MSAFLQTGDLATIKTSTFFPSHIGDCVLVIEETVSPLGDLDDYSKHYCQVLNLRTNTKHLIKKVDLVLIKPMK